MCPHSYVTTLGMFVGLASSKSQYKNAGEAGDFEGTYSDTIRWRVCDSMERIELTEVEPCEYFVRRGAVEESMEVFPECDVIFCIIFVEVEPLSLRVCEVAINLGISISSRYGTAFFSENTTESGLSMSWLGSRFEGRGANPLEVRESFFSLGRWTLRPDGRVIVVLKERNINGGLGRDISSSPLEILFDFPKPSLSFIETIETLFRVSSIQN